MTQRRQLARHAAPVDAIRKQCVEEVAHILPSRLAHCPLAFSDELGILLQVRAIRAHAKRGQPLLDLQVVEEGSEESRIGIGSLHVFSMSSVAGRGNDERGTGGSKSPVVRPSVLSHQFSAVSHQQEPCHPEAQRGTCSSPP